MRQPRPLDDGHLLHDLTRGVPQLDARLIQQAQRAQLRGTTSALVWSTLSRDVVLAYYSILPTQVRLGEISRGPAGEMSVVPSHLIARLALDTSLYGRGLESMLLARRRACRPADRAGGWSLSSNDMPYTAMKVTKCF